MKRLLWWIAGIIALSIISLNLSPAPARALTLPPIFNVNSTADVGADPSDTNYAVCRTAANNTICTLRAAIDKANHFAGGGIIIRLPAVTSPSKYALSAGTLLISNTMDIQGAGARGVVIDASANGISTTDGAIVVLAGAVSMSGLTIQGADTKGNGGGIKVSHQVTVTLDSVLIQNNHAYGYGGGIENLGALIIRNSAILSNSSEIFGGGIHDFFTADLLLQNSTLSNNTALMDGGAIIVGGNTLLFNDTIAYNSAGANLDQPDASGGISNNLVPFDVRNTILAPNFGTLKPAGTIIFGERDCTGAIHSTSTSIIGPAVAGCVYTGDWIHNAFPRLGPLSYNGGQTPTYALLSNSPALDAGEFPNCTDRFGSPILRDQRGARRPADGGVNGTRCDIGAVEMQRLLFLPLLMR
jgi:hypothetical protein